MHQATGRIGARTIVTAAAAAACALPALAGCDAKETGRSASGSSPSPSVVATGSPVAASSAGASGGQATATTSKPAGTRGVVDGKNTVFINAYNASAKTITLDPIDWFTGQDAVKACAADKQEPGPNDWCSGWYYRNNNKTTVTVPVASDVSIRLVFGADGSGCSDQATDPKCVVGLEQFPARLKEHTPMLAEVGVNRQTVISIREIYTP